MKKRLTVLIALLLALSLLSGCTLKSSSLSGRLEEMLEDIRGAFDGENVHNPDGIHFRDMHYERPAAEALYADVEAVKAALESGAKLKEVEELLDRCMDGYDHFETMLALADIYNSKDLRDEFFAAEYEWCSAEESEVSRHFDEMYYACAGSPLGAELEEDYFWEGFCEEYADPADSKYNDETVALMQRESELVSRYRELVADPTILYEGEERSYYELLGEFETIEDLDTFYRYLDMIRGYFEKYSVQLAEVYLELMRVRCEMAGKMGYASCEEMQYDFFFTRDFTPEQGNLFVEDVKTWLVPLYVWADNSGVLYSSEESALSPDELLSALRSVAKDIGGDCARAFDFMDRYGLCDIEQSPHKADTSFEIYLNEYDCPFVFLNPIGTTRDLMTFVHEFGHFTDGYVNFNASESIDLAECFSQGLEFLSLWHMDGVLSEKQIRSLRMAQTADALRTFVEQCAYAAFETRAYALGPDKLDAESLNELMLDTLVEFGVCPEGYESIYQYRWMEIPHLFEFPFYVISYAVSLDVAMQFYELELGEEGKGLEKYFEILPRDYDSFTETVVNGGLSDPFRKDALRPIAEAIAETLGYKGELAAAA